MRCRDGCRRRLQQRGGRSLRQAWRWSAAAASVSQPCKARRQAGLARSPIIAVDRVASKLALARRCGASEVVDASATDPVSAVRELTNGRGADFTFEVVGRSSTIRQAFDMTRRAGTCTIVGAGSFEDPVEFARCS